MLKIGQKAPDFSLPDQHNKPVSLQFFRGKWVVVYFYPKDNTPGCTIEAIDFTANISALTGLGAVVLGISPDSPKSHCNFIEKQKLKLTLLCDEDHSLAEKYGIWIEKSMYGRKYMGINRSTFLINPEGKLAVIWNSVSVKDHVKEVIEKIKELK